MTQPLVWQEVIAAATVTGRFPDPAKTASGDPVSCAVGERAEQLGVPHWSAPNRSHKLGMDFMYAVQADDVSAARHLLTLVKRWGARWSSEHLKKQQREYTI